MNTIATCLSFPHREKFGNKHPKHADTLLDYGFYLLNSDCVVPAVQVYQVSLFDCCLCFFKCRLSAPAEKKS